MRRCAPSQADSRSASAQETSDLYKATASYTQPCPDLREQAQSPPRGARAKRDVLLTRISSRTPGRRFRKRRWGVREPIRVSSPSASPPCPQHPPLLPLSGIRQPIETDQKADRPGSGQERLSSSNRRAGLSFRSAEQREQRFCREVPRGRSGERVGRRRRAAQSILCAAPSSVVARQAEHLKPQSKLCGKGQGSGRGRGRPSVEVVVEDDHSAARPRGRTIGASGSASDDVQTYDTE